ncbi:MAG: hypothetical protein CM1200mP37_4180 [Chloroflexota bacterium]|nr:MAG: hypothetical protein CM1200mP37_4180 [Chloroflexota bacterium]
MERIRFEKPYSKNHIWNSDCQHFTNGIFWISGKFAIIVTWNQFIYHCVHSYYFNLLNKFKGVVIMSAKQIQEPYDRIDISKHLKSIIQKM